MKNVTVQKADYTSAEAATNPKNPGRQTMNPSVSTVGEARTNGAVRANAVKATAIVQHRRGAPEQMLKLDEVHRPSVYEFRIKRHLDDGWSVCLEGLTILRQEDGTTLLVGTVVDQAALHGVIVQIRDLGLPLPSVRRTLEPQGSTY